MDIRATFLGAHVVPAEFRKRPDACVDLLVQRWIPTVAMAGLAGKFCDVFCDRGAFTVAQARRILTWGETLGAWFHHSRQAQLANTGAARLAIELHAASADHLEKINAADIRALALSPTLFVRCFPAAVFISGSVTTRPRVRSSTPEPSWASPRTSIPAPAPRSACP